MPGPAGLPPGDHLVAALEVHERDGRARGWRSWSRYFRFSAEQLITPPPSPWTASHSPIDLEPGVAVLVVQRLPGGHLGDVGRRVQVVGVLERHVQPLGEGGSDGGLAGAGDPHDDEDGWVRHATYSLG